MGVLLEVGRLIEVKAAPIEVFTLSQLLHENFAHARAPSRQNYIVFHDFTVVEAAQHDRIVVPRCIRCYFRDIINPLVLSCFRVELGLVDLMEVEFVHFIRDEGVIGQISAIYPIGFLDLEALEQEEARFNVDSLATCN